MPHAWQELALPDREFREGAWTHSETGRIDSLLCGAEILADCGNAITLYRNVSQDRVSAGAIINRPVDNQEIVLAGLGYLFWLPFGAGRETDRYKYEQCSSFQHLFNPWLDDRCRPSVME